MSIAAPLVIALIATVCITNAKGTGLRQDLTALESGPPNATASAPSGYTITLDVSSHPGAVVSENEVTANYGTPVEYLPFATLESMRFTGWYTAPEGDETAIKIDNNSLDLLTLNVDQTLYPHFEARPTSIDYDNAGLPILMYHYFYNPDLGESGADTNWMDIRLFRQHLAYLQSNNYYFPTWEEVGAYIRGEILLPEPSIVLCSDDGDESFFRLAAPLVLEHGAKMTSFIVLIDLFPGRLEVSDPTKIFIQSHSYDMHRGDHDGNARILTASYQEVLDDARAGQNILGNPLVYCYPYGKTNANAKQALAEAGVGVALVIENARAYPLCDPMEVPRLRMSDGATAQYLASVAY